MGEKIEHRVTLGLVPISARPPENCFMVAEAKIHELIDDWIVHREAAAALLVEHLHLESPQDVLRPEHRGRYELEGTGWSYRTHGIGVDMTRTNGHGGIDFDFGAENTFANPDWWRLFLFAKRWRKYADIVDGLSDSRAL